MVTPFLKNLSDDGGSLYVFPSASLDLTKTLVSSEYEFVFSHFACLNLPDIYSGTEIGDKGLYLEKLLPHNWDSDNMGNLLIENLQDYVMNFETAILNGDGDDDDYDSSIMTTVSEKVFFNWLQKIGGIVFDGDIESYTEYEDRTVQYIGNLDVMNAVEVDGDVFDELYIHIPGSVGASSSVYFRDGSFTDNKNYLENHTYKVSGDSEYIIGRSSDNGKSSYELNINAIFDDDTNNSYTSDTGHTIDFRDSSYGDGIMAMNENSLSSFEFNAVLIYYDLYKSTNTAGVKKRVTNLYGILFLDNITVNADGDSDDTTRKGYIQRYPKVKGTDGELGNSFALKIDLKVDTIPDDNYSNNIKNYNDINSPVSMSLYEKALTQLQKNNGIISDLENEVSSLRTRVSELENLMTGIDTVSTLKDEISELYDLYQGNSIVDTSALLSLIEVNSNKLDSIINGEKDIKLTFDTDVIQAGDGIEIEKETSSNTVTINNTQSKYVIDGVYMDYEYQDQITSDNPLDPSVSNVDCYLKLNKGENISIIYIDDAGSYNSPIVIHINDIDNEWSIGQSLKIFLKSAGEDSTLNLEDSYGIKVVMDSGFSIIISYTELENAKAIEIICIDNGEFIYLINK